MIAVFRQIANAGWFQKTVTGVILLAGVVVGLETYPAVMAVYGDELHLLNDIILLIFIIEVLVKLIADYPKPWRYFYDPWNVFDFLIVAAALLPYLGLSAGGSSVAVLRLLRLLRVLRLVRAIPRLQVLVGALLKSIPSMGYVALLLFLLFYIYAVAGTFLFQQNDPVHFGDLQRSFVSLYRAITLEDWTDLMYIQMHGCLDYPYGVEKFQLTCTEENSQAMPIASPIFFVSFTLLGTMIFLNLMVGVILAGMDEAQREQEEDERVSRTAGGAISLEDELHDLQKQSEELHKQLARVTLKLKNRINARSTDS